MDELQLKVSIHRATVIADTIEQFLIDNPGTEYHGELSHTLYWLRHRIALRQAAIARNAAD